jgi:hypothetical protein
MELLLREKMELLRRKKAVLDLRVTLPESFSKLPARAPRSAEKAMFSRRKNMELLRWENMEHSQRKNKELLQRKKYSGS